MRCIDSSLSESAAARLSLIIPRDVGAADKSREPYLRLGPEHQDSPLHPLTPVLLRPSSDPPPRLAHPPHTKQLHRERKYTLSDSITYSVQGRHHSYACTSCTSRFYTELPQIYLPAQNMCRLCMSALQMCIIRSVWR